MAPKWFTGDSTDLQASENKLTCTKATTNDVCNGLWEDAAEGVSSGQHYWKLKVTDLVEHASIFVGVTDKEKFKAGWAMKALLYGRNLSNGAALLVEDFGPQLSIGDEVGIFVTFEDKDNLKVYFDVNGRSLGVAYDLPKSTLKGIYPVAQFYGAGSLEVKKVDGTPASLIRPPRVWDGVNGDWELVKNELKVSGAAQEFPTPVTINVLEREPGKFHVSMRIVNTINFQLEREGSTWKSFDGMSTKMMGSPEAMKLEGQMQTLNANTTKFELEGSNLVWTNATASMESKWQRYAVEKSPVTRNPF